MQFNCVQLPKATIIAFSIILFWVVCCTMLSTKFQEKLRLLDMGDFLNAFCAGPELGGFPHDQRYYYSADALYIHML